MPGVGRGGNPSSHGSRPRKNDSHEQLETVPLPADRDTVNNTCMRGFLEDPMQADENTPLQFDEAEASGPVPVAIAPTGARVRGWLQQEIHMGVRDAPVHGRPNM